MAGYCGTSASCCLLFSDVVYFRIQTLIEARNIPIFNFVFYYIDLIYEHEIKLASNHVIVSVLCYSDSFIFRFKRNPQWVLIYIFNDIFKENVGGGGVCCRGGSAVKKHWSTGHCSRRLGFQLLAHPHGGSQMVAPVSGDTMPSSDVCEH